MFPKNIILSYRSKILSRGNGKDLFLLINVWGRVNFSDGPALRLTHSLLTLQDRSHTERRDARVSRNVEFLAV